MSYEIKNIVAEVIDVDDTSRRVKTAWNKLGVLDLDKDIIEMTAADKTIKERGPKGANLIWHLTDHRASLKDAVGKPSEIGVENNYLFAVTDIPTTTWGNDVLEFYKSKAINQHSIGFSTIKREVFNDNDYATRYTVIKEIKLYEGSAVLWGANPYTPTLTVGKSFTPEERKAEFDKTLDEYTVLTKLFKTGHLSDQSFELLEMRIAQLNEKLKSLYETTQSDVKSIEPEEEAQKWVQALTTFTNRKTVVT